MNQDKVKDLLDNYCPEDKKDFSVIFTGKESSRVDGLYNRETKEILIHNRNFKNDNELFYTALHELTHHIDLYEKPVVKGQKQHTRSFYAKLNELVNQAIEKGDYIEFEAPILNDILETGKEHTRLLKKQGKQLVELYDLCQRNHCSFEDVVLRKTGMTGAEAKSIMKMYAMDVSEELPGDLARKVAKITDNKTRKEAEENHALPPAKPPRDAEDEEVFLTKEKSRLEKQDIKICARLEEIDLLLEGLGS